MLVVASRLEEFKLVKECLPHWDCECVLFEKRSPPMLPAEFRPQTLLMVYARRSVRETFAQCEMLRHAAGLSEVPILIAVRPVRSRSSPRLIRC